MSSVSPSVSPTRLSRSLLNSTPRTLDTESPLFHSTSKPEDLSEDALLNAHELNGSRASITDHPVRTVFNAPANVPPLNFSSSNVPDENKPVIYPTSIWITFAAIMTGAVIPTAVLAWGVTSLFITIFFPPLHFAIIGVVVLISVSRLACSYYQRCHVMDQINHQELNVSWNSGQATMSEPVQLTPVDFFKDFNEFFFYSNYSLVHPDAVKNK